MNPKELLLAAKILKESADHYGEHSCNDFDFPGDWTQEETQKFVHAYHCWNGDPLEYRPNHLHLPDYAVMKFLACKLACMVEEKEST